MNNSTKNKSIRLSCFLWLNTLCKKLLGFLSLCLSIAIQLYHWELVSVCHEIHPHPKIKKNHCITITTRESHCVVVNALHCGWEISSSILSTDNKLSWQIHLQYVQYTFPQPSTWHSLVVRRGICWKLRPQTSCKLNHALSNPCYSFLWEWHSIGWLKMEHLPYSIRPGWCNNSVAYTRIVGTVEI